jgi:hypothetical protein
VAMGAQVSRRVAVATARRSKQDQPGELRRSCISSREYRVLAPNFCYRSGEAAVRSDVDLAVITQAWLTNWEHITPFMAFPPEVRCVIYTTTRSRP